MAKSINPRSGLSSAALRPFPQDIYDKYEEKKQQDLAYRGKVASDSLKQHQSFIF